jgi:anti-sigma B factor antagonist
MLQIATHEVSGALIVTCEAVESPVGDPAQSAHREALYHAVQTRPDPRFAVNLGDVDFLASADIGFLIGLKRRVEARQGRFVLFQVNPIILDVLRTMRLGQYFAVADDLNDALAKLGAS